MIGGMIDTFGIATLPVNRRLIRKVETRQVHATVPILKN